MGVLVREEGMEREANGGGDDGEAGWGEMGFSGDFNFEGMDGVGFGFFWAITFVLLGRRDGFVATFATFEDVFDSVVGASNRVEERVTRFVGCESGEDSIALRFLGGIWNGE